MSIDSSSDDKKATLLRMEDATSTRGEPRKPRLGPAGLDRRSHVDLGWLRDARVAAYEEHHSQYPWWGDQEPDTPYAPTPQAFNPVWSGLEALLSPEYQFATWADIQPPPGTLHITELFKTADKVVDRCLEATAACSQAVLRTYSSGAFTQPNPLRALERNAVKRLDERLNAWLELRQLPLNEVTYEAWMTLLRVAQNQHEQVLQMQAMADQHGLLGRRAAEGARLALVVSELACWLMQSGVLPPALAEEVARMTREQQDAVDVFKREGRIVEKQRIEALLFSPDRLRGINFRLADGVLPRPLLWPVKDGERKKGGTVQYNPGVHFKRHTEGAHAQRMATSYRDVADSLRLLQPLWFQLTDGKTDPRKQLAASLESLQRSFLNLSALIDAIYGNINRTRVERSHPDDAGSDEPYFDAAPDPWPSEAQWTVRPTVAYDPLQERIWLTFPKALAKLELSQHASEERQLFCAVCHRTKASKHYCFRHEDESARSREEIRNAAGRATLVDRVLNSSRTLRLAQYVQTLLDSRK